MRNSRGSVFAVVGALLLAGAMDASAARRYSQPKQDEWEKDVAIESLSFVKATDKESQRHHGVAVCTLSVKNISTVPRTVRLTANLWRWESDQGVYQQECTVAPGESATVIFKFLPADRPSSAGVLKVEIDGEEKGWFSLGLFPWRTQQFYHSPITYLPSKFLPSINVISALCEIL